MAWLLKNSRDVVTYLAVLPPKLRRSSVLLIGVLILLVWVLLFLLLLVIVFLFGLLVLIVRPGWLMVQPHVDEYVGDVVMHGRS